jgi:hypothetical protein
MTAVEAGNLPPSPFIVGPDVPVLYRIIEDPERQMLGARQEEWIRLEVASSVASGKPWQIFGNQVVMARFQGPDIQRALGGPEKVAAMAATLPPAAARRLQKYATYFSFDIPMDLDGWDGYPAARERIYDAIKASNANAIIVSGDSPRLLGEPALRQSRHNKGRRRIRRHVRDQSFGRRGTSNGRFCQADHGAQPRGAAQQPARARLHAADSHA